MVTKDLGMVTAYAYAVAGGYTGTEAQFEQLMADLAIVVDDFDNFSVTVTTLPEGSSATASYADGVLSLGIPKGDTGATGATGETGAPAGFGTVSATVDANIGTPSVEVTASGADTAKNFAFAFHNLKGQKGDKGDTGEVSEAELAEALEDFSENGTVANAEQLTTKIRANDQTPYLFRTSGGSVDIGDREYINGIVGGTVAWNQLVSESATSVTVQSGHKYIAKIGGAWSVAASSGSAISVTGGSDMLFDLTAMFGTTIADYIYSLEQANAGAGVAWFKSLFPKPYYAYNAGQLMSVSGLVSHDMTGFNQLSEQYVKGGYDTDGNPTTDATGQRWRIDDYTPIIPNTTYHMKMPDGFTSVDASGGLRFYDGAKNLVETRSVNGGTFTTPANAVYMRMFMYFRTAQTSMPSGLCINLSWDGSRNGEYEAYVKHSYPLDSDLVLRGVPKLDSSNNLYYDGDTYESDGTVTRKYGVVDLGTLTEWESSGEDSVFAHVPLKKVGSRSVLCDKLTYSTAQAISSVPYNGFRTYDASDGIAVKISGITVSNATTMLSGMMLVYELATPTTESAEPYTNPQIVDDFGTEEYVIANTVAVPIPVGHNTDYPIDLKAKVEMAPSSPDGDGDYIVRQANGENSYVALASTTTIQSIIARLEALENA